MRLTENAKKLLQARYCKANESPEQVFDRIANCIGEVSGKVKDYSCILKKLDFLPNSPCLMNAGYSNMMKACFTLGLGDSMDSIFKALHDAGIIFKEGGGVGYNFSTLREKGAPVSAGGTSTGALSFMQIFNGIVEAVKQGGKRRGASMGILDYDHPEILDFIKLKLTNNQMTNFNLSVLVNDEFMDKIDTDDNIYLRSRLDKRNIVGKIKARDLFDIISYSAWICGDPGMIFFDRVNEDNPYKEKINACNPCVTGDTLVLTPNGEITVEDFVKNIENYRSIICKDGIMRDISDVEINFNVPVYKIKLENGIEIKATASHQFYMWKEMANWESKGWWKLKNIISDEDIKIKCYDGTWQKIIEVISLPPETVYDLYEPILDTWITNGIISRGCGEQFLFPYESCCLGSINLANCVTKNGNLNKTKLKKLTKLGSEFLLDVNKLTKFAVEECHKQQYKYNRIGLGVMGFADMLCSMEIHYDSDRALKVIDEIGKILKEESKKIAPTSASRLSIAPTGSLSIIANTSASIEPIFSRSYKRKLTGDVGTIKEKRLDKFVRTAHEVSPEWHLKIQAQWQKWIDNGVSKTINLPNEASIGEIKDIYFKAWQMGCKGITVFRDGCKSEQVYYRSEEKSKYSKNKCDGEECTL